MNLSFLGQSSKQLIAESRYEQKENIASNKLRYQDTDKSLSSNVDAFKESIKNKQQERNIKKMERQIRNKDDLIAQANLKCERLECQLKKNKRNNKQLKDQSQQLKELVERRNAEVEQYQLKANQQRKHLRQQLHNKELKYQQTIQSLQSEIEKLKATLAAKDKQNKISINRLSLQNDQLKRQLEGKISVKEKQLAKVEQTFESRKKENSALINQQEQQIDQLCYKVSQLEQKIRVLTQDLKSSKETASIFESKANELEALYKQDIQKFSGQIDKLRKNYEYEQWVNKQTNQRLSRALKSFQLEFQLKECDFVDPCQVIEMYRVGVCQKLQKMKKVEEVAKLKEQIDKHRATEVQLRSKLNILQEELDFTKKNSNKNENLASIIKQHLSKHQKVYTGQKSALKEANNARSKSESKIIVHKANLKPAKQQNVVSYRIQSKLIENHPNKENKESFEIVKDELTSKKKSLVYQMFGANQQPKQAQIAPTTFIKSSQDQRAPDRRRSCSMGQLVRQRCQKKIQQE